MTSMAGTTSTAASTVTNPGAHQQQQQQQHHIRPSFDLARFWQEEMATTQTSVPDFRTHPLPLARIKKVMKSDPEVKMISAEAPILFAKACETFITELTKRAWVHAEESKRRTLLRSDIAMGISKTDMCDFLIDIVPRMEATTEASKSGNNTSTNPTTTTGAAMSTTFPYHHPPEQQHTSSSSASDKQSSTATSSAPIYLSEMSQMSEEQMQQYQLHFQQFMAHLTRAQQQDQQSQQQPPAAAAAAEDDKKNASES